MTLIYIPQGLQEPRRDCEIPKYRAELPTHDDGQPENTYRFHLPPGTLDARMSAKELAIILGPHLAGVLPFMAPDYLMLPTDRGYDRMRGFKLSDEKIALRYKIFTLHFSIYEEYRHMLIRLQTWPDNALDEVASWLKPLAKKTKVEEDDIIELSLYSKDKPVRTHTIFYGLDGEVLCSSPPPRKRESGLILPHNDLVSRAENRLNSAA